MFFRDTALIQKKLKFKTNDQLINLQLHLNVIQLISINFFKGSILDTNINTTIVSLNIERNYFSGHTSNTDTYPEGMIRDLNEINSVTNDAFSWLNGQFISSILKLNKNSTDFIREKRNEINIKKPYLG
jgi:hypothetical protein